MYCTRHFCQILIELDFILYRFSKNTRTSNFMKIRPVGAVSFYENGRTDEQK